MSSVAKPLDSGVLPEGEAAVRVRPMSWRDLPQVADLEKRSFPPDARSEATFWAELALRPDRVYLLAQDASGALLGYGGISVADDIADIMTLAVDGRARGLGVGGRLLDVLHEEARQAGALTMMLEVRADNEPARSLYTSRGYVVLNVRSGYYPPVHPDGDRVDALVMRKEMVEP